MELNLLGARAALRERPKVILCGHIVAAPAAWSARLHSRAPIVTYLYADEVPGHPRFLRFAIRQSDAVIAISQYTADLALQHGADPSRLHLIPPGVDIPSSRNGRREPNRNGPPTIVSVSRLEDRYKGHDVMLESMSDVRGQVPGVRWIVIGDGWLRPELEQRAAELGVRDMVEFRGQVSEEERDEALGEADVFAMPSRMPPNDTGGEGFGIVYLEAAVHGVPSVAGNRGGAVDAVVDEKTGLLVDAANPGAVAQGLTRLLTDDGLRRRLGEAARVRAQEFAWPNIASRVEELMCTLVEEE